MSFLASLFQPKASKSNITKFWVWFEKNSEIVFQFKMDQQDVLDSLTNELKKIHKDLTYEIGPEVEGIRELIISADGFKDAIPAVEETVKAAPSLPQWKIIAFRQPTETLLTVYYGNIIMPPDDVWFTARANGGKVDIQVYANGYSPVRKGDYLACTFLFMDQLLGEYAVMTRAGAIELSALPVDPPAAGLQPLAELKAFFA